MRSPPIVGVPCFTTCAAGPSARICWPRFLVRRTSMNFGPITTAATIASRPAIRTGTCSSEVRDLRCDAFEPHCSRGLDEHRVARSKGRARCFDRLLRVRRPGDGVVRASRLPHSDDLDAETRGQLADLAVIAIRLRSELCHLPEHSHPATISRPLREVLQRGAHGVGIGVVGVVDHEPAAGKRHLLSAPGRELDRPRAVRGALEREPERGVGVQRGQRVDRVMSLREREVELHDLAVERKPRRPVPAFDVLGIEPPNRDVVPTEIGLERRRSSRDDGGATRRKSGDRLRRSPRPPARRFREARDARRRCGSRPRSPEARSRRARRSVRGPRIPISVTRTSVSGSSLQTVSGRPISLLRLFSAQIVETCVAHSAPRTSLVVVFPAEPTTATTRARLLDRMSDASATSAASWSSGSSVAAPGPAFVDVPDPGVQSDEQVARPDLARVGLDPGDHIAVRSTLEPAEPEPSISSARTGITSPPSRPRATA